MKSLRFMSLIPATKKRVVIKMRKKIMKPLPPKQMYSSAELPNIVYPTIRLNIAVEKTKKKVSKKIEPRATADRA